MTSAIDHDTHRIYCDYSILSTFKTCKELGRLSRVQGYRLANRDPKLEFGHAIHAGWAAYYDALAGGFHDDNHKWNVFKDVSAERPLVQAQIAFIRDLKINTDGSTVLPVTLESEERRSIERGLALLDAYIYRWRNEPYRNILRPDGSPLVELSFQFPIARYQEFDIIMVGRIDRIMENIATGRPTIVEGKTTTRSLKAKIKEVKPNAQITTYFRGAQGIIAELGLEPIRECIWDLMFISKRVPNPGRGILDRFWNYGIDTVEDFARQTTQRSQSDITAFIFDEEQWAVEYAKWLLSGIPRWPRTAPGPCHQYAGCVFRGRCSMNIEPEAEADYMHSLDFIVDKWEPWREMLEEE